MFSPVADTLSLIPQRPPFVMIDHLTYSDETISRSTFNVRADNIFLKNGKLLEAALVENIAQTAAARAGYGSTMENQPVSIGYIGSVNNLKIFSLRKTGDQLTTQIAIVNQIFNVTLITGTIFCNDEVVATCDMKIFITQTKQM